MSSSASPQPRDPFYALALKIRPDLAALSATARTPLVTDILGCLLGWPLAIAGLAWLVAVTDLQLLAREWKVMLLMGALMLALNKLRFFFITNLHSGPSMYGHADVALDTMIRWSMVFLFGPTGLWIDHILNGSSSTVRLFREKTTDRRWNQAREAAFTITAASLFPLIAFSVYRAMGGTIPLSGLTLKTLLLGVSMLVVQLALDTLFLWAGYLAYSLWALRRLFSPGAISSVMNLVYIGLGAAFVCNLFAIPLASAYTDIGLLAYLAFALGVILVAVMGRRFSQAMEDSRQQAVQLEKLEVMGRAILAAPPDTSSLPAIMAEHAPAMFTMARMGIWLHPDIILLKQPADWPGSELETIRKWMENLTPTEAHSQAYTTRERLPWQPSSQQANNRHYPIIITPILDAENGALIGGIYVALVDLGRGWNRRSLAGLLPSAQSLAAQVASAVLQARVYQQTLTQHKIQQELAVARRIQLSFLPKELPSVPGWQLAACLEPAREVAGDFYDLIPLPSGALGILIADVADKGVGPALFMALSRTLVRTFAVQYETQPETVLESANRRIIDDAGETLFVTLFYGILDPHTGALVYANAGHNPPWLFHTDGEIQSLGATGMPLGIELMARWKSGAVQLARGEVLMLYTDGAADAQNQAGEFYSQDRLYQTVRARLDLPVPEMQAAILADIRAHIGGAPQFDDITLLVVKREV